MFYVYILKSEKDDSLYIGYSSDLKRRFEEHKKGKVFSTKFKLPLKLVYYEAYSIKKDAEKREKNLKRFAGAMNALRRRVNF